MKKIIVLALVALSTLGLQAQKTKNTPPPPPPPPPPVEEVKFIPPVIEANDLVAPPPPPKAPATPPPPPAAPKPPKKMINPKGYNISVKTVNGAGTVIVKGKGINKTISLKEWLANEKVYEAKYGKLPPPPPPPPPPMEEVKFIPPVIEKN